MSPINLELGLSSSAGSGAAAGAGDFAVGGNGVGFIVLLALAAVVGLFALRKA